MQNSNIGIQVTSTIAWDGAASFAHSIAEFNLFAWSFEVVGAIAADAVFNVEAADPDPADPCVPGAFFPVQEIATCAGGAAGGDQTITIPAGTTVGAVCSGTIPCRPAKFIRLVDGGGDTANVRVTLARKGPASAGSNPNDVREFGGFPGTL